MTMSRIDPDRLAAEIAEDAAVLAELAYSGDIAALVRPIDLHFKGPQDRVEALVADADALGLTFIEFGEYEDGDIAADFTVEATTDAAAMAELTRRALEIEIGYSVEYEGWGCEAQTGQQD